jgi:uncharacterized membrane protein YphA (DoxX/SURF4 family)
MRLPRIPTRYYPGFWGALFLILLRTAIGWHFLYEGLVKIQSVPAHRDSVPGRLLMTVFPPPPEKLKETPFSAEGYLRNATGPLAPTFRGMIPDVNSLSKIQTDESGRPMRLKETWNALLQRTAEHYGFDSSQRSQAETALRAAEANADAWFLLPDNRDKVHKYLAELRKVMLIERDPNALPSQKEAAWKMRREVESTRKELVAEIDGWTKDLSTQWKGLASEAQKARGDVPAPFTFLDLSNILVMWGLVAVGLGLMLGFLTPLSALGAAGFLAMFYLAMPPFRGLPENPLAEGHYLIVNKNLIELLACLVLASTPNGLWLGLDALFFGRFDRRRHARKMERTLEELGESAGINLPVHSRGTASRR